MKPDFFSASQDVHTKWINETLNTIGRVTPRDGLEGRVAIHLAHARNQPDAPTAHRGFSWLRLVATATSCAVACAAIITGSVHHSRANLPAAPNGDIRLMMPSGGMGAASAAHLPTQEVTPTGRPRAVRKSPDKSPDESSAKTADGRATIASDAKRRAGEAVPQQP